MLTIFGRDAVEIPARPGDERATGKRSDSKPVTAVQQLEFRSFRETAEKNAHESSIELRGRNRD